VYNCWVNKCVFVGGFGEGPDTTTRVGQALNGYFDEVETFTLSDFVRHESKVAKAAQESTMVSHSMGAFALTREAIRPDSVILLNPPLPISWSYFSVAAPMVLLRETLRMSMNSVISLADSIGQIATNPRSNLWHAPDSFSFDAIQAVIDARNRLPNLRARIVWTEQDTLYQPTDQDLLRAEEASIPVTLLDGEHNEAILRPEKFFPHVFKRNV
jgi:hypothetical protein